MYLGTVPANPGIYILPNSSIALHEVESLALGPPPPKNQDLHIPGVKRAQAPDGGRKAHQRALAHITLHPTAHLPKDFGTKRHIVLEGQAQHVITAALYTLAAHEHHWDPTAISARPPPLQGPKDPVTPFHTDQLLRCGATPHLQPARTELAIASWDTLDTPSQRRAVHILKANAQWWVLHDTQSRHGSRGLHPRSRPGRPPMRPAATPAGHHPHGPRGCPVGSPPHGALLGSRIPQRSRHTGTHGGLAQTGQGHKELPPPPAV